MDKRPDGTYFVRISSTQPVNEPYLDLMVELTWSTGRVIREYTVLLDPPSLRADAPVLPPVASTASPLRPLFSARPLQPYSGDPISGTEYDRLLLTAPAADASAAPHANAHRARLRDRCSTARDRGAGRLLRRQVGRHAGRDCGSQQAGVGFSRSDAGRNAARKSGRVRC